MVAVKSQDVMDKLLSCEKPEPLPESQKLNQLIYREDHALGQDKGQGDDSGDHIDQIWTASHDKVTVEVWESRAKIHVKVSQQTHQQISMKGIADIAVKAIITELKRDAR
jgi:hypothetical protein